MGRYRKQIIRLLRNASAEQQPWNEILALFNIDIAELDQPPSGLQSNPAIVPDGTGLTQEQWTAERKKKIAAMIDRAKSMGIQLGYNHGTPPKIIGAVRSGESISLHWYDKGSRIPGYTADEGRYEAYASFFRSGPEFLGYSFADLQKANASGNVAEFRRAADARFLAAYGIELTEPIPYPPVA